MKDQVKDEVKVKAKSVRLRMEGVKICVNLWDLRENEILRTVTETTEYHRIP